MTLQMLRGQRGCVNVYQNYPGIIESLPSPSIVQSSVLRVHDVPLLPDLDDGEDILVVGQSLPVDGDPVVAPGDQSHQLPLRTHLVLHRDTVRGRQLQLAESFVKYFSGRQNIFRSPEQLLGLRLVAVHVHLVCLDHDVCQGVGLGQLDADTRLVDAVHQPVLHSVLRPVRGQSGLSQAELETNLCEVFTVPLQGLLWAL